MSYKLYEMSKEDRRVLGLFVTHFNIYFNTSNKYIKVFKKLSSVVDTTTCSREVWCLITNTARALHYGASGWKFPRDHHKYTGNVQKISNRKLLRVVDTLADNGYLVCYQGGVVSFKNDEAVSSLVMFTQKYLDLWNEVIVDDTDEVIDVVEIRDRETKLPIKLDRRAAPVVKAVEKYNKVLSQMNISLDGVNLPVQQYKRIFNGSLQLGGRYYNTVGGIQVMSESKRSKLEINSERTVELDFKALHPSILYDKLYQTNPDIVDAWLGDSTDLYDIDVSFIPVDKEKVDFIRDNFKPNYNPIRNLIKMVVLIGLNAFDLKSAYLGVANKLYEDKRKYWESSPEKSKFYGIIIERDTNGGSMFPAKMLCEYVQAEHSPIGEFFFADKGVELQYIDSEIISQVLTNLIEDNEILLSEHDSIIVRESLKERVEHLMRASYKSVVGSDRFCCIETK